MVFMIRSIFKVSYGWPRGVNIQVAYMAAAPHMQSENCLLLGDLRFHVAAVRAALLLLRAAVGRGGSQQLGHDFSRELASRMHALQDVLELLRHFRRWVCQYCPKYDRLLYSKGQSLMGEGARISKTTLRTRDWRAGYDPIDQPAARQILLQRKVSPELHIAIYYMYVYIYIYSYNLAV